jgi:hypothetical protein
MADLSSHPLMQRWNAFLDKTVARLGEIEFEAAEGLRGLRADEPTNDIAYNNALHALDRRVDQLYAKIDETWEKQVEPMFSEAAPSVRGLHDAGLDRKADVRFAMQERWAHFSARQRGDFYRDLEPAARAELGAQVNCSQCAAPLTRADALASESIRCVACGAINQVSPTPVLVTWANAPTAFADEQVVGLRFEIERFRHETDRRQRNKRMRDDHSSEGLASLERWEAMERNYWTRFAELVGQFSGKPTDHALVNARMKSFLMYGLEMNQEWVKAHGKRSQQM